MIFPWERPLREVLAAVKREANARKARGEDYITAGLDWGLDYAHGTIYLRNVPSPRGGVILGAFEAVIRRRGRTIQRVRLE